MGVGVLLRQFEFGYDVLVVVFMMQLQIVALIMLRLVITLNYNKWIMRTTTSVMLIEMV